MFQRITSLILISFVLTACGGFQSQSVSESAKAEPAQGTIQLKSSNVKSMRYFRGGWFPAPGQPNWSHDIIIEFLSNGLAAINGKTVDPLCGLSGGLDESKTALLLQQLEHLRISKNLDKVSAVDAGSEFIEITYNDLTTHKIDLLNLGYGIFLGEFFAENSAELINLLQSTVLNLPQFCSSLK